MHFSPLLLLSCLLAATTQAQEVVDCTEFQASHSFANVPITLDYVVTVDESSPNGGLFTAQVTYEGQGYVSMGLSTDGRMVGSLAMIGLPDEPDSPQNPGKYDMTSQLNSGVTLTNQQTLMDGSVVQNDTHTVLTFSKYLQEDGEIAIDPNGNNFILVAAGISNPLGLHFYRASAGLTFSPCQEGAIISSNTTTQAPAVLEVTIDTKQSSFKAHGWLAVIAWGILAPLAIANSLCRHLIPGAGIWFQMHRGLNVLVLIMTTVCFAVVVKAINDTSAGGSASHFAPSDGAMGKHRTIGLVVFILVILQSLGGIFRPHATEKGEKPTALRILWEVGHKVAGLALLAMGWYQCHSGLVLYAQRFQQSNDYVNVFWAITASIFGVGVLGKIHGVLTIPKEAEEEVEQKGQEDAQEHAKDNDEYDG